MSNITDHTSLLNYLATTFNLQSYLEIGVRKPELNFDKIKCSYKHGVEPELKYSYKGVYVETSDEFFDQWIEKPVGKRKYDLIFIDGLHHADQVKRDFENSLKCLTDHGFIVIHDTLPTHEKYTHVPRDSRIWYGDVYKFACSLCNVPNIDFVTVNIDCGCTVVWRHTPWLEWSCGEVKSWDQFIEEKWRLCEVSVEGFKNMITRKFDNSLRHDLTAKA